MFPSLDDVVEFVSRALGDLDLSLAEQFVVGSQFTFLDSVFEEITRSLELFQAWLFVLEVTDKSDSDALGVVTVGVVTGCLPAAALVDVAVAADQEVVDDVVGSFLADVHGLDVPHVVDAVLPTSANAVTFVADDHVRGWDLVQLFGCVPGR